MAGKNGTDSEIERENERQGRGGRTTVSYHLVEMYSTILRSEPLTVRPVTVFHSLRRCLRCTAQPACAIPPQQAL